MSASIQVLTRAIQPLEILTRKDAPMCLAEIAEASGLPKSSAYPVSKAGLIMFTKCLAVEYAAEGIRANAFCPGQLLTDMNVKRYAREAAAEGCTPEETMRRAIDWSSDVCSSDLPLPPSRSDASARPEMWALPPGSSFRTLPPT